MVVFQIKQHSLEHAFRKGIMQTGKSKMGSVKWVQFRSLANRQRLAIIMLRIMYIGSESQ